jgi:hypothetical protein
LLSLGCGCGILLESFTLLRLLSTWWTHFWRIQNRFKGSSRRAGEEMRLEWWIASTRRPFGDVCCRAVNLFNRLWEVFLTHYVDCLT